MHAITSHDLHSYSRWFLSVLEPIWHPFKALPNPKLPPNPDLRFLSSQYQWRVEISDSVDSIKNIEEEKHLIQTTNLLRLLVEASIVMTPAASPFNDFRAGNSALRYSQYFKPLQLENKNKLILNSDPSLRSIRLRALMAEELALGIAAFLAREYFDVVHLADYKLWQMVGIDKTSIEYPDLACLDELGQTILLESKGSISSRCSSMNLQRKRAAARLLNTQIPAQRIIVATCLLHDNFEQDSISLIEKVKQEDIEDLDGVKVKTELSRLAYAKIFRLAGRDEEADAMVTGSPFNNSALSKHFPVKVYGRDFIPIGMDSLDNLILVEGQTLSELKEGKIPNVPKRYIKNGSSTKDSPIEEKLAFTINESVLIFPSPVYFEGTN
ncbi:MAG: hypothetical protein IPG59_20985 [Candidatus Melainabacteria bacterium]|nr:MAG: hypothetical protein IPG59_20985 [Candidatus Melainabacteria bacterium]